MAPLLICDTNLPEWEFPHLAPLLICDTNLPGWVFPHLAPCLICDKNTPNQTVQNGCSPTWPRS